ncbi:Hint domain-containing protein [Halovulum sp. GXIMD14793]
MVQGYVFPDGQTPLPAGNYTITSTFDIGYFGQGPRIDVTTLEQDIVCFARGTLIETSNGPVAVEDLTAGDMIRTLDNGEQPLRWVGSQGVPAQGNMAPVVIKAGALGNDRDLVVSPKHRILLDGWRVELLFNEKEALVTADSLLNDTTITCREGGEVEYFHLLFDRHQIIFAEGIPSESFHPAEQGMGKLAEASRQEILQLFPQLADGIDTYGPPARRTLQASEVALLN